LFWPGALSGVAEDDRSYADVAVATRLRSAITEPMKDYRALLLFPWVK